MTTTIEISEETKVQLDKMNEFDFPIDSLIKSLIVAKEANVKYISDYVKSKNGACVDKIILSERVIANHRFGGDKICAKCGMIMNFKV